jgi:hypothetical protein
MKRIKWAALLLIGVLPAGVPVESGAEPAAGQLSLSPQQIEIGFFYDGANVRVEGEAQEGSEVILVVRGSDTEETFNKKVRAGPIWISSGKVRIAEAPSLFLIYSKNPVESILPAELIARHQLAPDAIKHHMTIDAGGDVIDEEVIGDNYVTMKVEGRIYQVHTGEEEGPAVSNRSFSLDLRWPRTALPADYEVAAYECRKGQVVRISRGSLRLIKAGLPADIYAFAMENSRQYGLLAVLLAVMAGFGIDFLTSRVFGSKVKAGH